MGGLEMVNLPEVVSFESHAGHGVMGQVAAPCGMRVYPVGSTECLTFSEGELVVVKVGAPRFFNESISFGVAGVGIDDEIDHFLAEHEPLGRTVCLVSVGSPTSDVHSVVGAIAISDKLRPESKAVVSELTSRGVQVQMLTGDNAMAANFIVHQLGLDPECVTSNVLPGDKARVVRDLHLTGVVAFVGDGINDAPALAEADVGIAIGAGTDVAIDVADVVLMKSSLADVLVAIDLSSKTFNRIRMNFAWALVYNLIGIPLAAGWLYWCPTSRIMIPPWLGGLAMAMSSVSVVTSSLMLRTYTPPIQGSAVVREGVRRAGRGGMEGRDAGMSLLA